MSTKNNVQTTATAVDGMKMIDEEAVYEQSNDLFDHEKNAPAEQPIYSAGTTDLVKQGNVNPTRSKKKGLSLAWRLRLKKLKRFMSIKILQILLLAYIAMMSYARVGTFGIYGGFVDPERGFIIDANSEENTERGVIFTRGTERVIVADTPFQMVCLGITRASAFFMYPALVLIFTTKFRATMSFLSSTTLSLFLIQEHHELHVYCGYVIFIDGWIHTLFHFFRWADQGNMNLVFDHWTGRSGFVVILVLNFICIPMMFSFFRRRISYEIRKYAHYLFIVFAIALAFHSPTSTIPNGGFTAYVFPILIIWWLLDWTYVHLFMTEKIETTLFHVLPTGVQLTMRVSDRFRKWGTGGYCYVCLPWVDKTQWHAFSLFESPSNENDRQVFLLKAGDWTNKVHEVLQRDTVRPVWVQGPFQSPYSNADAYDNQILVAGGIGITPALSVIQAHKESRRTNLIWAVRDPAMLEFFLEHAYLDHKGWNLIFYTGDQSQLSPVIEEFTSTNLCVIMGRPDLGKIIPNIIYGIESGKGLPERYLPDQKEEATILLADKLKHLDAAKNSHLTSAQKLAEVAAYAQELGFLFTDILKTDEQYDNDESNNDEINKDHSTNSTGDKTTDILNALRRYSDNDDEVQNALASIATGIKTNQSRASFIRTPTRMSSITHQIRRPSVEERAILQDFRQHPSLRASAGSKDSDGRPRLPSHDRSDELAVPEPVPLHQKSNRVLSSSIRHRGPNKNKTHESMVLEGMREEMVSLNQKSFEPWQDIPEASEYCKNLDVEKVLTTWGMLYCGGAKVLEDTLKEVSEEYQLEFHSESFAW